ncbi:Acp2 [Symbiodinium pilosum]|uniref:Acp2 protein n=1 Tax=Symbiodinium pilosum TaxID=2952 RepID=A0A812VM06_SYMPI|nr:Acp2 [Symbiodinium pilosum]
MASDDRLKLLLEFASLGTRLPTSVKLTPRTSRTPRATEDQNSWTLRQQKWKGIKAQLAAKAEAHSAQQRIKPLTLLGGGEKPHLPPLPPTLRTSDLPAKDVEQIQSTYHWRPVQIREHCFASDEPGRTLGTYVNTLSFNLAPQTLQGAKPLQVRLASGNFTAQGAVWCYILEDSFVQCRGVVIGTCPKTHDPENGRNIRICRLPVEARPRRGLQFAALSREAYDVGGHITYTSSRVALTVTPDGWICGHSTREMEGAIDLSAIRFCKQGGISLTDEVTLHTVDVRGSRLVCLQGHLSECFYVLESKRPLAMLPESCRPKEVLHFVTPGSGPGAFHLIQVRPTQGSGIGGDLMWKDGVWNHDQVHLTGIMYEVSADSLALSFLDASWSPEILKIFVAEFQKFLMAKFGSIDDAWIEAFDLNGLGVVNFTQFSVGCKKAGYVGNATRLWAAINDDHGDVICLDQLAKNYLEPEQPGYSQLLDMGNAELPAAALPEGTR